MLNAPEYSIVLYDLSNQPVMDISRFVTLTWTPVLNDVHTLSFEIDLVQFEKQCAAIGALPRNLIYPQRTEVKMSRNGIQLFGGIISHADSTLGENGANLSVQADSYIHYFSTRYISKNYLNTDRSDIAWDAINTVQSIPNGDLGVTRGVHTPTYNSDLTSDYQDVKYIIQRYTYAKPVTYDFEITPDKVFNTYLRLGSDKPEIELVYPQNIVSMGVPRSSDSLANKIIGFGSGIGEERIQTIQEDSISKITYRIKERKVTFNSVKESGTLIQNTQGVLEQSTGVLVIPNVKVNPGELDISNVKVGDSVYVRVDGSTYNNDVNGLLRIFKMTVNVNEDINEDISLDFYNPNAGGEVEEE